MADADNEADLCDEYQKWCEAQGLPLYSADELLHEDITPDQRKWLSDFCLRWEVVVGAQ